MDEVRETDGRFKKGVCPNPKGRPRKQRTVNSAILDAANAPIIANENGTRRKMRKIEASAAQLANKGASGDIRAGKMLLDMAARAESEQKSVEVTDLPLSQTDQEILDKFLAEYREHLRMHPQ